MDDLTEKHISSEQQYRGRIIKVRVDEVELPSGMKSYREVVEHPGAVAVIGKNEQGQLIFVKQFRYPTGQALLEIPAGKLDPGETPEDCAIREMKEETGYRPGKLQLLSSLYTSPGFCNEVIHVFAGLNMTYEGLPDEDGTSPPAGDHEYDEENLRIIYLEPDTALKMIYSGEIIDAKTVAAVLMMQNKGQTRQEIKP